MAIVVVSNLVDEFYLIALARQSRKATTQDQRDCFAIWQFRRNAGGSGRRPRPRRFDDVSRFAEGVMSAVRVRRHCLILRPISLRTFVVFTFLTSFAKLTSKHS